MGRGGFLLRELVRRDVEQRYRGSALGFFWALLEPAWQLLLFTFIFSWVLRIELPGEETGSFPIFLFAGLVAWNPVRQGVERATTAISDNAALIKNHRFPPRLFVLATVLAELIHGLLALVLFVVVLLVVGHGPPLRSLPVLALALPLQFALTVGIALLTSAAHVYARDVRQGLGLVMTSWFYLTPVVYPIALVPRGLRTLVEMNPSTGLVELYRSALLGGEVHLIPTLALLIGGLGVFLIGWSSFARVAPAFADEI